MKTKTMLALAGLFASSLANAQTNFQPTEAAHLITPEEAVYFIVPIELRPDSNDSNAWFPDLKNYVAEHARYPAVAQESGWEGVVEAEATVGTDGVLSNIQIVKGLNYGCDKEVKRLLGEMPAWNPARSNGKPVQQRVSVRVRFRLQPF